MDGTYSNWRIQGFAQYSEIIASSPYGDFTKVLTGNIMELYSHSSIDPVVTALLFQMQSIATPLSAYVFELYDD